jgi:transcription elongation factor S-II
MRVIEDPDKFRAAVREELKVYLGNDEKHATNLEKGVHNWAIQHANTRKVVKKWDNPYFVQIYVDHLRSVYANLQRQELVDRVLSGAMKAHELAFMTHQEMNPEKWRPLIEAKIQRDKHKYEVNMEAATDMFTCRRCRGKKCTYMQLQTRGGDEAMTTYVTCLTCGCHWKC